jgi:hypothetical protein
MTQHECYSLLQDLRQELLAALNKLYDKRRGATPGSERYQFLTYEIHAAQRSLQKIEANMDHQLQAL